MRIKKISILPILTIFVLVALWYIATSLLSIESYILPAPDLVLNAFTKNIQTLFLYSAATIFAALIGFLLANTISILLAIWFTYSRTVQASLYPLLISLKSTPVIALAPLLIIWFGYGTSSKVVMAAIISFFPLVINASQGFQDINEPHLNYMRTLTTSKWKIFWNLRLPCALPTIFAALKISSTMAVVGAIIAEMMGSQVGIGRTIMVSSMSLDTPLLFASIIISSLIGMIFFYSIVLLEKILNISNYAIKK